MTKTQTYRVSRINADEMNLTYTPERAFRTATEETVNQVRAAMRADIEPGSSDWITVRAI
jgi:hypothetical protein